MGASPKPGGPVLAVLAAVGLVLAGIGLAARPELTLRRDFDSFADAAQLVLALVVLVVDLLIVAYLLARRRVSGKGPLRSRSLLRQVVVGIALGLVLAFVLSRIRVPPKRESGAPHDAGAGPNAPDRAAPAHDPRHLWLSLALLAVVVVAVGGFVWWRRRQARDTDAQPPAPPPLAAALQAAAAALDGAGDPRARVIDAYDAMERALAAAGQRREPQDSPREWLAAVARGHPEVAHAATGLTELFEVARFSHEPVTAADADAAGRMVGQLRRQIEPDAVLVGS